MAFYKTAALLMSGLMLFSLAGCRIGGKHSNDTTDQNGDSTEDPSGPGNQTGGNGGDNTGDNTGGDQTGGNSGEGGGQGEQEPPTVDPTDPVYVYGEDQSDPYDAAYTRTLLGMGEQAFTYSQLTGVDYYRRERVPTSGNKDGKYVGIFYFLWQNEGNGLYDISKLLDQYGADTEKNPLFALKGSEYYNGDISPMNAFHYFEEPLYGYYASTDKWVIMRHLELLAYAGVDFLYLDFTNANSADPAKQPVNVYPEATFALLDSILELQEKGIDCPKIVPVICNPFTGGAKVSANQRRANVVQWVYANYYAQENFKYKSCWFTADKERNPSGKPLIVTYTVERDDFADKNAYDAFWIRQVVWPTMVSPDSYQNGFPWMDYELPQANYDGFMNVSVAQHLGGSWSSEAYLARQLNNNSYRYRGRGATGNKVTAVETDDYEDALYGLNFNEQWRNAINATGAREPWLVTVTGWNEWIAQKLDQGLRHSIFVDTFSVAFSRDAEMMRDKGGYSDNFYMQLAANVAKFKAKPSERKSDAAMWQKHTLDIGDIASWGLVDAKYIDFSGDAMARDKDSVGHVYRYTDDSARNDIEYLKFANDEEYLYVLVSTKDEVTPYEVGDECWMNLYLSTKRRGWQGYDFVINRDPQGAFTSIEALSEDEEGNIVATKLSAQAEYKVFGKYIAYAIPLEAIGVTSKDVIGIKACDNIFGVKRTEAGEETLGNDGVGVYKFGDIEAFYCGGDCAPIGRLNYAYRMAY